MLHLHTNIPFVTSTYIDCSLCQSKISVVIRWTCTFFRVNLPLVMYTRIFVY